MTREELLKALRPLKWRELSMTRKTYKADQFIDGYAFISEVYPKWITSFDEVNYNTLEEARQAAEEYRKAKILAHSSIEQK